nr:hypothetical protein Iba_chr12fCG19490 [Ipomoea batatas]
MISIQSSSSYSLLRLPSSVTSIQSSSSLPRHPPSATTRNSRKSLVDWEIRNSASEFNFFTSSSIFRDFFYVDPSSKELGGSKFGGSNG